MELWVANLIIVTSIFGVFYRPEPVSRHLICATERALFLVNCLNYDVDIKAYHEDVIGPPVINHASFSQDRRNGKVMLKQAVPMF